MTLKLEKMSVSSENVDRPMTPSLSNILWRHLGKTDQSNEAQVPTNK